MSAGPKQIDAGRQKLFDKLSAGNPFVRETFEVTKGKVVKCTQCDLLLNFRDVACLRRHYYSVRHSEKGKVAILSKEYDTYTDDKDRWRQALMFKVMSSMAAQLQFLVTRPFFGLKTSKEEYDAYLLQSEKAMTEIKVGRNVGDLYTALAGAGLEGSHLPEPPMLP